MLFSFPLSPLSTNSAQFIQCILVLQTVIVFTIETHVSVGYLRSLTIKVTTILYMRVKVKRHKMKTFPQASRDRAEVRHHQTFPAK